MPEPTDRQQAAPEPDFFDRLLARHTPTPAPARNVARVRPRLAGPFERVEAVRARGEGLAESEETATGSLWPSAPQLPSADGGLRPPVTHVRTEHERTVVRTEQPGETTGLIREVVRKPSEAPLLWPSTSVRPKGVVGPTVTGRRTTGADEQGSPSPTPPVGSPVASPLTPPAPAFGPAPRPGSGDSATVARSAARAAAGRRGPRGGERTVHVQIGRLEVSAQGSADRRREEPREGAGRRPPGLDLAEFLRRNAEDR